VFCGCVGSSVGESVNCRYFNGYIHIRHLLALFSWAVGELDEKDPSDCCGLPTAAQISPPPAPPHRHVEDGGLQVDEII